jgi:hypothetical protein
MRTYSIPRMACRPPAAVVRATLADLARVERHARGDVRRAMATSASCTRAAGAGTPFNTTTGGGGGPTNDPTFVSVGTGFELATTNTTGPFDVPYPGSLAAGYIIFLHIMSRTPASIPATIAGWTTAYHDDIAANSRESAVFYKTATGSETGSQSVTFLVNSNSAVGIMTAFSNVNIAAGFEDAALGQASGGSYTGPTIATNGDHRMCFAFVGYDNQLSLTPFGAVTGGTWVERYDFGSSVGSNCGIHLQTAIMTAAGTITGGTMSIGSDDGCMRSFAMVGT